MILLLNNGSRLLPQIKDYLKSRGVAFKDHPYYLREAPKQTPEITGVLMTGGDIYAYRSEESESNYYVLKKFDVPMLGLCLGNQIMALAHGGEIEKMPKRQEKVDTVKILDKEDPIFAGIDGDVVLLKKGHKRRVKTTPVDFKVIATSAMNPVEIIRHKDKPIYGIQGHPEKGLDKHGIQILDNFLRMCGELEEDKQYIPVSFNYQACCSSSTMEATSHSK